MKTIENELFVKQTTKEIFYPTETIETQQKIIAYLKNEQKIIAVTKQKLFLQNGLSKEFVSFLTSFENFSLGEIKENVNRQKKHNYKHESVENEILEVEKKEFLEFYESAKSQLKI